jgi:hypothetical protein
MGAGVVHHHHLPRAQHGAENLLDVSFEDRASSRALRRRRRAYSLCHHARKQRSAVRSPVTTHRAVSHFSASRLGVQHRKLSVRAHLIHEDEPLRIYLRGKRHSPGGSQLLVSLHRPHRSPFLVEAHPLEQSQNSGVAQDVTVVCFKKGPLSETAAAGRSFTSSSNSFCVDSSVFGGLLPPFLDLRYFHRLAILA